MNITTVYKWKSLIYSTICNSTDSRSSTIQHNARSNNLLCIPNKTTIKYLHLALTVSILSFCDYLSKENFMSDRDQDRKEMWRVRGVWGEWGWKGSTESCSLSLLFPMIYKNKLCAPFYQSSYLNLTTSNLNKEHRSSSVKFKLT